MSEISKRLVCDLPPKENNPRNSEGAFLRAPNGEILFAYSEYHGTSGHDHAACNIALIRSSDEGEHWSETSEIIAPASFFGTKNVMSVSALTLTDGALAFYFLVKENDCTSRVISHIGFEITVESVIVCFIVKEDCSTLICIVTSENTFKLIAFSKITEKDCSTAGVIYFIIIKFSRNYVIGCFSLET